MSGVAGSRRPLAWLAAGALAGIALAAASLVRCGAPATGSAGAAAPPDSVALVNGEPISREALARFTAAIARERGRLDLDPAEQRRILERLIDEELLLQRGVALGLERREPAARRAIVSAVVDALTSAESAEPDRAALEAFYREDPAAWARPGRVMLEAARIPAEVPEPEASQRADEIVRRARAGESLAEIAADLAQPIEPPLPAEPIEVEALRDRVGGVVVAALLALQPGAVSEPVRAFDGVWVVRLVAREPDVVPPLEDVWEQVQQAWLAREHEKTLQAAIAALRSEARVEILDPALAAD
jgi:hypothetical protein